MKELISVHLLDGNPSYDSLSLYQNQVLVFIMGVLRTRGYIRTGGNFILCHSKTYPHLLWFWGPLSHTLHMNYSFLCHKYCTCTYLYLYSYSHLRYGVGWGVGGVVYLSVNTSNFNSVSIIYYLLNLMLPIPHSVTIC